MNRNPSLVGKSLLGWLAHLFSFPSARPIVYFDSLCEGLRYPRAVFHVTPKRRLKAGRVAGRHFDGALRIGTAVRSPKA
jgi:hypothetical protein